MLILLFLIFIILQIFLFIKIYKQKNYWKLRGIPGPKPKFLKGNIDLIFGKNPSSLQFFKWTKKYGKVYGIKNGWKNQLIISDSEMIKEMLIDKFDNMYGRSLSPLVGDVDTRKLIDFFAAKGKRWKRLRSIANPAFTISNLKRVMPIIDDSIKINIKLLKEAQLNGNSVDIHEYFIELTFDIISRIAMGQKESKQFNSEYCKLAQDGFERMNNNIFDYYAFIFPWFGENIIGPFVRSTGKLRKDPLEILILKIYEAVNKRKEEKILNKNKEDNDKKWIDFIDLFLEKEINTNEIELIKNNGIYNKSEKFERFNTIDEIVFNCILFLLAGFDTTANTLSLISYNLILYPKIQQKLFDEINEICGLDKDEIPNYEQLSKLKYADAIFYETQRLYPIATSVVNRVCEQTTTLGGITLEKGTIVSADLFSLHRDKKIWGNDSEEFKPERWLNDEGGLIVSQSFYPFGGGPRICIGMKLAMMEIKMVLVQLLKAFELKKCSKTEVDLNLSGQVVLNPGTINVKLITRE